MSGQKLHIDIVSDVVCPWCVIGWKRLAQALTAFPDLEVTTRWHAFELNPAMPQGGQNLREHLAQKYGTTLEGSIAARKKLTNLGADLGFTFDYFDEMRMYNTFQAHQLLLWAAEHDKQTELKMRLFSAFFGERKAVDDPEVLIQEAAAVGLDADQARKILSEETYARAVREEQDDWREKGVYAVPTFVFNQKYAAQGAQEVAHLQASIKRILDQEATQPV